MEKIKQFVAKHSTVGTSPQLAVAHNVQAHRHVRVKASLANSDLVYVGHDASVSDTNGWQLDGGEEITLPVADTDKVWVIGGDTGQGYSVLVV